MNEEAINQEAKKFKLKDLESICADFMDFLKGDYREKPDLNQFWDYVRQNFFRSQKEQLISAYKLNFFSYFESQIILDELRQEYEKNVTSPGVRLIL